MESEEEKITMVVFSGTIDRLIGMGILTNAAIAMDYSVNIYLMLWGTYALKRKIYIKHQWKTTGSLQKKLPVFLPRKYAFYVKKDNT